MSLFGGGGTQASTQTVASGVTIQSSCYGGVVPVWYGRTRGTGNLIWYGDFQSIAQKSSSGSGKGGGGGNGGKGGSTSTDYKASFIFALGEGTLTDVQNIWSSKSQTPFGSSNLSLANGSLTQAPWGYLTTNHSAQALTYAGTAYVYAAAYDLGNSAQLPNLSFEVTGLFANAISGLPDADPKDVVTDILTNPRYGVGFPAARLGSLSAFSNYCRATGMVISPRFDTQQAAASWLSQIVQDCNAEFVWSGTTLTIVPYGDQNLSANGAAYTAPSAPLYTLTDDDYLDSSGGDPVQCSRKRPSDQWNSIKVEWLNRGNQYNVEIVETKDQAAIEAYGLRGDQAAQSHQFCNLGAATMSATLKLQRQAVRNQYMFTLGWRYCLLDPMDIVAISDTALGLEDQWVRILSMEEDDNGNIKVTAEEYLDGTGAAPLYSYAAGSPFIANYNSAPGSANAPVIFEPPPQMLAAMSAGVPQIMIGASGGANWGGADVFISVDNVTYAHAGKIISPVRQGFLTAGLASHADPDTADILAVDLTESLGALVSATASDRDAFRTLCLVNGELVSFQTATLTGTNKYSLTSLRRGVYGSAIAAHLTGAPFCRLDDAVIAVDLPLTPISYVGQTIYVKLCSFNIFGGGEESISSVPAYTYVPDGIGGFVAAPSGIAATPSYFVQTDGTVISDFGIGWTASPDLVFDQYEIQFQGTGAGWASPQDILIKAPAVSYALYPVVPGASYDIRVRAIRSASPGGGPFYSAWSTVTGVVSVSKGTGPTDASSLTATAGVLGNQLNWVASPDSGIKGYNVYRSTSATFTGALLTFVQALAYLDQSVTAGTAYYYWVEAVDTNGNLSTPIGPASATALLVNTANVTNNAITTSGFVAAFATDFWFGLGGHAFTGPTVVTSGFPVNVEIGVTLGNANNPGAAPAGSINAYPFRAPANVIIDVYRNSTLAGTVHVSGVLCPLGGGEFVMDLAGDMGTSGRATLKLVDSPGADTWTYSIVVTAYGTYSSGTTFTFPFTNVMIAALEQKK